MKRIVFPLMLILLLAGSGVYLLRRGGGHAREVATWLPGGTVFFEDMPDIHRTRDRWAGTELAQIINEPEVQAFLEKPLGRVPDRAEVDKRLAQVGRIDPGQFFLAVTEWGGTGGPKVIAGLAYAGDKGEVDSLVDEVRKEAQRMWPEGKSDIEKYGAGEIETFTTPSFSAALAYRGQWLFLATDTELLKATLDRYEGKATADSLAELPEFKSSLEHLPAAPDNVIFVRPALLSDKLASLAMMANPTADLSGMDKVKRIAAMSMGLKLDGAVMRDATYTIDADLGEASPLAKDSLKLSSSSTIIATSGRLQTLEQVQLPDPKSDPSGILALAESYLKAFTDQGLGLQQLTEAFGPETGFVLDWPNGAVAPTPLLMADVRDQAKAKKFMDTLPTLPLAAGVSFARTEDGGISFYSLPQTGLGMVSLQVTLGLTGKGVIGGLSTDAVKQASKSWDAGGEGLAATQGYKDAAALVQEPTLSFMYVDTQAIFERVYGLFRGVASMGLVPHLSDYVEIGKLPAPETISKHLSPLVSSGAAKDGGVLVESAGPVTTMQAALATGALAGVAAVPFIEAQMKGQSVSIPGFPGFGTGNGGAGGSPGTNPFNQGGSAPAPSAAGSPAPGGN